MWLLLTLGMGIWLLFYIYKRDRFNYWNKRNTPTASGCHWLYGHYTDVFFQKKHLSAVVEEMYNEFPESPVVGYFRMHTPALLVRDPELMKTILISEFTNFESNGFFIGKEYDFLAGWNPFFVQGKEWRTVRGHLAAALTAAKLRWYLPRIRAVGDEMRGYVARTCAGAATEIDVKDLASRFATDVLGAAVCGVASASFAGRALFGRVTGEVSFATSVRDNLADALQSTWPALRRVFKMRFSSPKSEELLLYITRKVIEERTASGEQRDDLYQVAMSLREKDTEGESMRIFSPVPLLSRECTSDCSISIPGRERPLKVAKGTPIINASQSMHMDPKYYPAPGKFDPERFSEKQAAERPKYTYLPFGEGPKRCPGFRLGVLQDKVAVMSLVEHFSLRTAAKFPLDIIPGIFLIACPVSPVNIIFEPIQ